MIAQICKKILIKVSVILPTYNRFYSLTRCVESLISQTLDCKFWELIIVNDGGKDVSDIQRLFDNNFNYNLVYQKNKGPAAARNVGAEIASGEILAFIDDDCMADINWLLNILSSVQEGEVIGGKVVNYYHNNNYSEASQLLIEYLYHVNRGTPNSFFTTNNLALYRSDFMKLRGFSSSFKTSAGEDREFGVRANAKGMTHQIENSILVTHAHFLTAKTFFKLHKKYGYAAFHFHKEIVVLEQKIDTNPKFRFYYGLVTFPFQKEYSVRRRIHLCLLLVISQLYVALGFYQNRFNFFGQ